MLAKMFDGTTPTLREARMPDPLPAAGQLLIDVHACGVCRIDLHVVDGDAVVPGCAAAMHRPRRVRKRDLARRTGPCLTATGHSTSLPGSPTIRCVHRAPYCKAARESPP